MDGAIYKWDILTGTRESDNIQKSCIYTDVVFSPKTGNILAVSTDFKLKEIRGEEVSPKKSSYDYLCIKFQSQQLNFTIHNEPEL